MDDSVPFPPDINRGSEILVVCGSLVGLSVAVVILRIWVRAKMVRLVGLDDYFMIAATVTIFAEMMVIIPEVQYGAGRHIQYIEPKSNIVTGLHLNFVTQPLCLIALCLAKVSVGMFLLRITPSGKFRHVIWGIIIFTVFSALGNFLTVFFQCQPLAFTWDFSIEGGKCIPQADLKFAAFFNSMQLNWKVKSAVIGVLSLGIFATIAAVIKISFLSGYGKHGDFLFNSTDITIWTTVEICTAIIAASIPCLKPLFKAILSGSSAEHYNSSKYNNDGYMRNKNASKSRRARTPEGNFEMFSQSRHTAAIRSGFGSKMGSEESIIPDHGSGGEGITKTMQVSVFVDERQKSPKDLV
ncbi:hypothetical protein CSIM01_02172 [Colletotrichum simmondsii]|uniref:Rhodopsin domain-containing protein n=1 Tax=Colletotrichum simmondsii TaxID=703756 RepID=A0A135RZM0_9PEZI|nr:hypothetical protein CSIM01_02172 [Colletotrichum simmondsii]